MCVRGGGGFHMSERILSLMSNSSGLKMGGNGVIVIGECKADVAVSLGTLYPVGNSNSTESNSSSDRSLRFHQLNC